MKLGVSIVNYFSSDEIRGLLDSIVRTGVGSVATIAIVCNSCNDEEFAKIEGLIAEFGETTCILPPIRSRINGGYARGNNQGADLLLEDGCDVLWVLNPDTRVLELDREELNAFCGQNKNRIAATARRGPGGELFPDVCQLSFWTGRSKAATSLKKSSFARVSYPAGHSILVGKEAWTRLRGFSEQYFLFCEEPDLILRAEALKIPVGFAPIATVAHLGGSTTGATAEIEEKSNLAFRTASESKILFINAHRPRRLPIVVLARLVYAAVAFAKSGPPAGQSVLVGTMHGLQKSRRAESLR